MKSFPRGSAIVGTKESHMIMKATTDQTLQLLSNQDFAAFGVNHVAYVRPITVQDAKVFSVHAADGTQLTVLPERDVAFAAVRQYEMEPLSVH